MSLHFIMRNLRSIECEILNKGIKILIRFSVFMKST